MAVQYTVIPGTERPDRLFGTTKAEFIYGDLGDDRIKGGGGNDLILGDDARFVGWPEEAAKPFTSNDRLFGGNGDDVLVGGADDDVLTGGNGQDVFVFDRWSAPSDGFDDLVYTTGGNDIATDFVHGVDRIAILDEENDLDNQIHRTDFLPFDRFDTNGNGRLEAGDDAVRIEQVAFDGKTALSTIIDHKGEIVLHGVVGLTAADFVTPGVALVSPFYFASWDATITGEFRDERISGTAGSDIINDLGGNDTIRGLGGDDRIDGGIGNDILLGGWGDDFLTGNGGNDQLYGEGGRDRLQGGPGYNRLFGGDGDDFLEIAGDPNTPGWGLADGGAGNDLLRGDAGRDILRGGDGDDDLLGYSSYPEGIANSEADQLHGGDGNDTLWDGPDADLLDGGSGDDELRLDERANIVRGGTGSDRFLVQSFLQTNESVPGNNLIVDFTRGEDRLGLEARDKAGWRSFQDLDTNGNGVIDGRDAGWMVKGVEVDGYVRSSLVYDRFPLAENSETVTLYAVNRLDAQDIFAGSSY